MLREECREGMQVHFGRPNGRQTLAEVVKCNPTRAKVLVLEARGGRPDPAAIWYVPYRMLRPAAQHPPQALDFNPLDTVNNQILLAVVGVYTGLSPENLAQDGEASLAHIRTARAALQRKLKALQEALGRSVSEEQAFAWDKARRDWLRQQPHAPAQQSVFYGSRRPSR